MSSYIATIYLKSGAIFEVDVTDITITLSEKDESGWQVIETLDTTADTFVGARKLAYVHPRDVIAVVTRRRINNKIQETE